MASGESDLNLRANKFDLFLLIIIFTHTEADRLIVFSWLHTSTDRKNLEEIKAKIIPAQIMTMLKNRKHSQFYDKSMLNSRESFVPCSIFQLFIYCRKYWFLYDLFRYHGDK